MAKKKQNSNPLVGAGTKPTPRDDSARIDIDTTQSLADNIIQAGLQSKLDLSAIDQFTSMSTARETMYSLIDTMLQDSTVSSVVRTFAEDICEPSDSGKIIWCESLDPKISKFVNYILDVMNVDKHIFTWAYNLVAYGDVYLKLYRESDYADVLFKPDHVERAYSARNVLNESVDESLNLNVRRSSDAYSYYVEMVRDPSTMFELTKYGKSFGYIETPNLPTAAATNMYADQSGTSSTSYCYRVKSNDVNVWQADDYVHAFMTDRTSRSEETVQIFTTDSDYDSNTNAYEYTVRRGTSMIYDSYKIWRQKSLLENAVLLTRLTRSGIIRKVSVEVGDMPKEQVQKTLRRVKEMFEQKTAYDTNSSMAEYSSSAPIENNVYFATNNGKGAVTVDSVGGDVNVKDLADLDNWNNKFYASYGIPKQYFGWTDDGAGFNGGSSLTIISSVYAKAVKRGQNALIQAITDAVNLILISKGCTSYLNNFQIKMKSPVTQEEKDYRDALTSRISAISNCQSLFADIESKERKLKITKALVSTLDLGDEILQTIDEEIDDAHAADLAAKEAEKAQQAEGSDEPAAEESSADEGADDLTPIPDDELEMLDAEESFKPQEGSQLLHESPDAISQADLCVSQHEDEDLPTPEELGEDFTKNK